jgi:ankyrin repeat protein
VVVEDDSHLEDFVLAAKNFQWDKVWELLGRFPYYADKRPPYRRYAAIHQAACSGEVDVLQRLVKEFGASPILPTKDGQTPLQVAQEYGNEEAAACLESLSTEHPAKKLKTGAADDAAAPDPALVGQANELIEKAKWAKWEDMFKLIEAHPQAVNVRPDYRVFGVIHQAAYHGELDVLKRLVHVGANPALKTRDGHTALQVALKEAHGEVVSYLSSLKLPDAGDPGAKSEEEQAHAVIDAAKEGDWDRAFSLLDAGPAGLVNMRPEVRLYGVFHQAAYHGDVEVLRRLIEDFKANVKQLTKEGENALQIAISRNQEAAAKYLEACFPAIKLDDDFVTYPEQRFVTLSKAELVQFQDLLNKTHKKSDNWTRDRDHASGKFEFKTPVPSGYELVGVKRNENAPLWRIYQVAREVMRMECAKAGAVKPFETWTPKTAEGLDWPELKLCNDANEWLLWHAGLPEALSAIARTGFTMAKLGSGGTTGGGGLYGNGTYFADSITKADEYARRKVEEKGVFKGCRAVALVRVLGGRHYYTDKDVTEAQKPQFEKRVLEGHYHSTVGDRLKLKNTFREYVAYDASCTYLEFILYYKRKGVPKKHE